MPRSTSTSSYHQLRDSGRQLTQETQILQILRNNTTTEDLTLKEISRLSGLEINAVSGRVNGMKKKGMVREAPKRKCWVTDRWVTPVMPT